jgi:hypothetical protein
MLSTVHVLYYNKLLTRIKACERFFSYLLETRFVVAPRVKVNFQQIIK